jgi:hypothetical protein
MHSKLTLHRASDTNSFESVSPDDQNDWWVNERNTVRELLTESKQIVLDLGGVTYLDGVGLDRGTCADCTGGPWVSLSHSATTPSQNQT